MKIFLKDTVYRYAYYLIGAAWLFTLSFIFSNYWSYTSSPQGVKKTLQQNLNRQEEDFGGFIKDSSLILRLVNTQESDNEVEQMIAKKYGIFIYALEDYGPINLKYWNTQQTLPTDEMLVKQDGEYMESLPNGQFAFIRRKISLGERNLLICALLPIRWDYFIENDYLKKGFVDQPNIEKNYSISSIPTGIPIMNLRGKTLFYLEKKSNSGTGSSDWVTILLRILGTMFILFYIHMLGLGMAKRFGPVNAIFLLVLLIVLLRVISYYFSIPVNFREFELFSPTIYGTNMILKTLGDLLINSLLFVWIILFSRSMVNRYTPRLNLSSPVLRITAAILVSAILVVITWVSGFIIRSLVSDSAISYEVTNFFKLNIYSVIGFIVLSCVSMGYFIFSHILFQFLDELLPSKFLVKVLLISFLGLLFLTFGLNRQLISFDLGLLLWLIIYLSLVSWSGNKGGRRISGSSTVFWLVFFSASITIIIFSENSKRELEIRKSAAVKLAEQTNASSDFLISIATQSLNNDFLRDNLPRFSDFYQSAQLKDSIINDNFQGYANKFDTRLFMFDAEGNPLSTSDKLTYDTLNTIFTMQGKKTGVADLRSYETDFTNFSYIFRKNVRDTTGIVIAQFFMLSNPRRYKSEALYPELIKQSNDLSFERWPSYAYAVYDSLELKYNKNDYPFPINLEKSEIPIEEYHNEVTDGYEVLWYKAGADKVVIITRKSNFILEAITLFAYLFCASLFLVALFQLASLIIKSGFQWSLLRDLWQMSIKNQIYSTIIFISIFSFIVIGAATIIFFIQRYNKNNKDRLSRTIQVMSGELRDKLANESLKDNVLNMYDSSYLENIQDAITEISEIHNADINLYDGDGILRFSSQPFVYNKGILSRLMEPRAYYHMKHLRKSQYVQNEKYGQLKYLSIYTPFKSKDPEIKAYINIPYFASTMELKQEISNFLVAIINLNAFIFLMAGVIAVFITNRITQSFTWIGQKMQEVNLGKHNQEITWGRRDEIGGLVMEYNKMVRKLDDSAVALAKTEREGAWREMARQVAHEIKNPLTPMKLSIQYLQKAIDNNAPNVKELSSSVARTLIEQIEHLSKIAAEFSQFANIGNTQNEDVDLHELMNSLVSLHSMHENIEINWKPINQTVHIFADKTQLNRLFTNLLQNAIEAIPDNRNGIIEIEEQIVDDAIKISIRDNGSGIPEEMRSKIFTPNFTTKTSGTGLGLAMSKGIVEKAQGELWFETNEGKGTTFFIKFPLAMAETV